MLRSSFSEGLGEIVTVKGDSLPAVRARKVRRDAANVDVEAPVAHLFLLSWNIL